jgi:hypothetical protein
MSADVKTLGTIKTAPHISYVETRLGTTYSFYCNGRPVSIQLIRTNGKVEYVNPNLPDTISPQLRLDLGKVSKHFSATFARQTSSNGRTR